jgi:hypothetical protein
VSPARPPQRTGCRELHPPTCLACVLSAAPSARNLEVYRPKRSAKFHELFKRNAGDVLDVRFENTSKACRTTARASGVELADGQRLSASIVAIHINPKLLLDVVADALLKTLATACNAIAASRRTSGWKQPISSSTP